VSQSIGGGIDTIDSETLTMRSFRRTADGSSGL
jgi:hypothetical protein